jgi:hypothetical protein
MSIFSKSLERGYTEIFENVMALYTALKEDEYLLRIRRNQTPQGDPLDFLYDVQLKTRRALPSFDSQVFLRMADAGNYGLASPETKIALGRIYAEFGLGIDGAYKKLYYRTKNEQVRQALKTALREPLEDNNGRCIE